VLPDAPGRRGVRGGLPTAGAPPAQTPTPSPTPTSTSTTSPPPTCCPDLHRAVELVGRRWSGAILWVLLDADRPLRFTDIRAAVPDISDRLLAERLRELEAHDLVAPADAAPGYVPTRSARELRPALLELRAWARRWLA
jgi:DNA-binding HxlR family transcriptional regulator